MSHHIQLLYILTTRCTTSYVGGYDFLKFDWLGIQNLAKGTKRRLIPQSKKNIYGSQI